LALNRPMVEICRFSPSSPSARIACGVFASGYRRRVARLTPTSVACADSTTATSSSNAVVYSSSVVGEGSSSARRENSSWTSAFDSWLRRPPALRGRRTAAAIMGVARGPGRAPAPRPPRVEVPAWRTGPPALPPPAGAHRARPRAAPGARCAAGSARAHSRPRAAAAAPAPAARATPDRDRRPRPHPPPSDRPPARHRHRLRAAAPAGAADRALREPRGRGRRAPCSASPERRLALVEEGGRALAHVLAGEHQPELRGLVFQPFLQP